MSGSADENSCFSAFRDQPTMPTNAAHRCPDHASHGALPVGARGLPTFISRHSIAPALVPGVFSPDLIF